MSLSVHRGEILHFTGNPAIDGEQAIEYFEDGVLIIENGLVHRCGAASDVIQQLSADIEIKHHPHSLIMPGLIDTHVGLILPLIASATGTFFFRQFFRSVPDELLEAARLDGATPWGFFVDILVPLSKTMIAAILIIMFVVGWNQYLWPLIMTTKEENYTLVIGIKQIYQILAEGGELPQYQKAFALTILATLPPVLVVLVFQNWFVKGLVESEK